MDTAYIYVRLSRAEVQGEGTLEDKLTNRVEQCQELAKRHGLAVATDNVIIETKSGGSLSGRPGMLKLLELAQVGRVSHIITPYADRLTRGDKADEQAVEDALYDGEVTVITHDGVERFDEDRDPLPMEIRLLVARHERRNTIKKRRRADLQRLRQNIRSTGVAPYGYRRIGVIDGRDCYEIVADEWPTVREMFRRSLEGEPIGRIASDFQARDLRTRNGIHWSRLVIWQTVQNPFYAGYLSKRSRSIARGRKLDGTPAKDPRAYLKPQDYILAEQQGGWQTALTLDQWRDLCERLKTVPRGRPPRNFLLSGILHCCDGRSMGGAVDLYACSHQNVVGHPGGRINLSKADPWARGAIERMIANLPEASLLYKPPDSDMAASRLAEARRQLSEERKAYLALQDHFEALIRSWGAAEYTDKCEKAKASVERLTNEVKMLTAAASAPNLGRALELIREIREEPELLWEGPIAEQREIIKAFISRIDLDPVVGKHHPVRGATITWHSFFEPYGESRPPMAARPKR